MSHTCPLPPSHRRRTRTRRALRSESGAALLQRFVDTHFSGSLAAFARAADLTPSFVSRLLSGDRGEALAVESAKKIHAATGGSVPWFAWSADHRAPDEIPQAAAAAPTVG